MYYQDLDLIDEFCGAGGSSTGAKLVPGILVRFAANHWDLAISTHALNHPHADHYCGDIAAYDVAKFPIARLAWFSPVCPPWSNARGKRRDFDLASRQLSLFGQEEPETPAALQRSRALMEEVPRYLAMCALRGRPVLAAVVENVVEVVFWAEFKRWRKEIEDLGYKTKIIALNSMHAEGPRSARAPQSRDRFFLAIWYVGLRRDPDWDKWLRPRAWCENCQEIVNAVQVFKKPTTIMGRYKAQYIYRCPKVSCRGREVEPNVLPASAVIDWSDLGKVIGERKKPLADKTLARIRAGVEKYATPFVAPSGGTWRDGVVPVGSPLPARTTRENDALVVPPLLVPMEGRPGKKAQPIDLAMRTQTTRAENALVVPPFISTLRGGGSQKAAYRIEGAAPTVTASGNHLALTVPDGAFYVKNYGSDRPQDMSRPVSDPFHTVTATDHHSLVVPDALTVPYNGRGTARPAGEPIGTQTAVERWALANWSEQDIDQAFWDVVMHARFRMLKVEEVSAVMAFPDTYHLLGNKRDRVRQLGNAVTPPCAEVLMSALVECVTGTQLERYVLAA